MPGIVEDIITQAELLAASTFGATYQRLPYVYNVEKNDLRGAKLAYGVRALSAASFGSITRVYALDHDFELILTDTVARPVNDDERRTVLNTMYDKSDSFFKALVNTKLNLASTVLQVYEPSLLEPEFLDDSKFVILRMRFKVQYRSNLN
jgi:hypothetical protein